MFTESLLIKADLCASIAHSAVGQRRKYTYEPYVEHCRRVAIILASISADNEVLAAGLLHDLVENTDIDYDILVSFFNIRIADLVLSVTNVSNKSLGSRDIRKRLDREHIAEGSIDTKNIKLADGIDNMPSIIEYDPDFAEIYIKEKVLLFDECLQEGDDILKRKYSNIINNFYK